MTTQSRRRRLTLLDNTFCFVISYMLHLCFVISYMLHVNAEPTSKTVRFSIAFRLPQLGNSWFGATGPICQKCAFPESSKRENISYFCQHTFWIAYLKFEMCLFVTLICFSDEEWWQILEKLRPGAHVSLVPLPDHLSLQTGKKRERERVISANRLCELRIRNLKCVCA